MGIINSFEFEGELISVAKARGDLPGYLWLEGLSPKGYTTAANFEIPDDMAEKIMAADKHSRIQICGHIEVRSKMSDSGKIKKRLILVVDTLLSIKDNKGYEID